MTACPTCGAEVREAQKFCVECGYRLVAPKTRLEGLASAPSDVASGIRIGNRAAAAELSDSGADNADDAQAAAPVPARRATEGYHFNASAPRSSESSDGDFFDGDADDFFSRYRRKGTAAESFDLNGDPHKDLPQELPMSRRSRRRFNPDLTTISPVEQAASASAEGQPAGAEAATEVPAREETVTPSPSSAQTSSVSQPAAPSDAASADSSPESEHRATTPDSAIPPRVGDRDSKRPSWVAAAAAAGTAGAAASEGSPAHPASEHTGNPRAYASEPIMVGDLLAEDQDPANEQADERTDAQLPETKAAEIIRPDAEDASRERASRAETEHGVDDAAEPVDAGDGAPIAPSARVPMWFNDLFEEPGPDATGVAPRLSGDETPGESEADEPASAEATSPDSTSDVTTADEDAADAVEARENQREERADEVVPPTSVLPVVSDIHDESATSAQAPEEVPVQEAAQAPEADSIVSAPIAAEATPPAQEAASIPAPSDEGDEADADEWLPSWLQGHAEPQPARPVPARSAAGTGPIVDDQQAFAEWAEQGREEAPQQHEATHENVPSAPEQQHTAKPLLPPMDAAEAGESAGPRRSSFDELLGSEDDDAPIVGFDFEQTGMLPRDLLQNAGTPTMSDPHASDPAQSWSRPADTASTTASPREVTPGAAAAGVAAAAGATALGASAGAGTGPVQNATGEQARAPRPRRAGNTGNRPARPSAAPAPAASAPANRGPQAATSPTEAAAGASAATALSGGSRSDKLGAMLASLDRPDRKRLLTILVAAAGSLLLVLSTFMIGGVIGARQQPAAAPSETAAPAAPVETPTPTESTPPPIVADPNFETVSFYSPTQKMVCQISGDIGVACQQWGYAYAKPDAVCDPGDKLGTIVGLTSNGVSFPCLPSPLYGNTTINPGDTIEAGEFSCHLHEKTGMRCVNQAGDAFVLDRNNGLMTGGRMETVQPTPGATPGN